MNASPNFSAALTLLGPTRTGLLCAWPSDSAQKSYAVRCGSLGLLSALEDLVFVVRRSRKCLTKCEELAKEISSDTVNKIGVKASTTHGCSANVDQVSASAQEDETADYGSKVVAGQARAAVTSDGHNIVERVSSAEVEATLNEAAAGWTKDAPGPATVPFTRFGSVPVEQGVP